MFDKNSNDQLGIWFHTYRQSLKQNIHGLIQCSEEEADDLLMEAFERACRSLKSKPEKIDKPLMWLAKFVKYVCLEERRRRRLKHEREYHTRPFTTEDGEENSLLDSITDEDETTQPEQITEKRERAKDLDEAIASLPENEKKAIFYHYKEELTLQQTGQKLGRATSTVSKDVKQGLEKLRAHLVK